MKKIVLSLAMATLLFSACKKDDNGDTAGSFTAGNTKVTTNYAFRGIGEFLFTNFNLQDTSFSGKISFVDFELETPVDGTTYTYNGDGGTFDPTKNFGGAQVGVKIAYAHGSITSDQDTTTALMYEDVSAGSITYHMSADSTYKISYSLTFPVGNSQTTVKGNYAGKMKLID